MKFKKLLIHNIASIEDAEIDFDAKPLADSEVFLITGKTGAGKSTILDAICLALYADTPRLDSTKMQGGTMDSDNEVKIDDPRQLMRRNTVDASVRLTFEGSNGVNYEATWAVARSFRRITGTLKKKTWELKNLDTDTTITKDAEIKEEIKAAVGLEFSQFCRTTMLAQGEFTRFLNSKDDDKAEILEKITGVDIYSKIGAKIYELTGRKRQDWEDAKRRVEGTRTLSDTEIAEKKEVLADLDTQFGELKALRDRDAVKRDWIRTDAELSKAVTDAAEELRKATEVIEGEDFKGKESLVSQWNATIDARVWKGEMDRAVREKAKQQRVIDSLASEFKELLGGQKSVEDEMAKIDGEIKDTDSFLAGEKDKVPAYENAQTIVGHLNTIDGGRRAVAKGKTEIDRENRLLADELVPAFDKARDNAAEAKTAFDKEEADVKAREEEIAALNLNGLRRERDASKELLTNIKSARERIQTLVSAREQREGNRKALAERFSAIEDKKKKSAGMEGPIHDAELKMNIRREDLDRQKDTVDKFASTLRLKLRIGDRCPVCRQEIVSELPHEEELAELVSGLQKAFEEAEKEHRELADARLKLDAEIKTETIAYDRDVKSFEKDKSVDTAERKALEACRICGIEMLDSTTLASLDDLENVIKGKNDALDKTISEGEANETAVKKLRNALETRRRQVESLAGSVQKAEKAVNECKGRISTVEALVHSKNGEVEIAENSVRELLVMGSWETDWNESPKAFGDALKSAARIYNEKNQRKQMLSNKLGTAKAEYMNVASVITSITEAMPEWKGIDAEKGVKADGLLVKANGIDNKVAVALTHLKSADESYDTNKAKLDAFLAENESLSVERLDVLATYTSADIGRIGDELKTDRDAVLAKDTLLVKAKEQFAKHEQNKPELTDNDTFDALAELIEGYENRLSEIGEKKGGINQELKTDAENKQKLGTLIQEAEDKNALYQKWSRINQLIGDANGAKFRKIAQSYVLTSLIHSANSYMKTLTDRYTLKVTPGTFVISLEDAYQGYVSRAASTISGGESFLVSLSLALALSDIGQQWQVDTLFIDEGFGTLSGEPLQKAIETLRSLHSKAGRHVGIISHVEELQERIPVQIQVNQEGNASSSKIKIVP